MTAERNLVLVHTPGYQAVEDFQSIGRAVQELAPDIEVFIASNSISSSVTRRQAGRRPSLIFSPGKLLSFRPMRGKVYAGSPIPKLEQIERFHAARLPVPATAEIKPNVDLPKAVFGSYVVVKPGFSESSRGQFITLMRREAVNFQSRERFAQDHPGRYGRCSRKIHRYRHLCKSLPCADALRCSPPCVQNHVGRGKTCTQLER